MHHNNMSGNNSRLKRTVLEPVQVIRSNSSGLNTKASKQPAELNKKPIAPPRGSRVQKAKNSKQIKPVGLRSHSQQNVNANMSPSGFSSGNDSENLVAPKPIITGVARWEEHQDLSTGRIFFFNPETNVNSWGLPLKDLLPSNVAKALPASDDWECHVDSQTYKRFYRSEKLNRVQWVPPPIYVNAISKTPYFTKEFVKESVRARKHETITRSEYTAGEVLKLLQLRAVLDHHITCAGFHRYLVAVYAEENILFYGACEVFEKGEWQGQTILGERLAKRKTNRGDEADAELDEGQAALYNQLRATHASVRMGLDAGVTSMKQQANIIYEKFVKPKSELWVCVSDDIAQRIKDRMDASSNTTNLFGLFAEAQQEVYDNMADALFPDFAKGVIERVEIKGFQSDEVLRIAVLDLAKFR